jgi:hypothetical protein
MAVLCTFYIVLSTLYNVYCTSQARNSSFVRQCPHSPPHARARSRRGRRRSRRASIPCTSIRVGRGRSLRMVCDMIFSILSFLFQTPNSRLLTSIPNSQFEIPSAASLDHRLTHPCLAGLAHCTSCTLKENLWLCLTCGSLGCGRAQYGAGNLSGNGHGLKHYEDTKHPVSVKLGTISAEGAAGKTFVDHKRRSMVMLTCTLATSADIYCYACNDARIDPELGAHLATFGINVAAQQKTEKSMTELVSRIYISTSASLFRYLFVSTQTQTPTSF